MMNRRLLSMLLVCMLLLSGNTFLPAPAQAAELIEQTQELVPEATRNVALNAAVKASGICNNNERADFAVDGKTNTKWCDNTNLKERWLEVDLGKSYNINQWVVKNACIGESGRCPFRNTNEFSLQISSDGQTWMDADKVVNNSTTIVSRYIQAVETRYARLYITKAGIQDNVARVYEFELWGTDADKLPAYPATNKQPLDYVDPFINTLGDNGQTNPGATSPFGLVSLGPDSDGGAFSGYYYENLNLEGFSHVRFSGVGCSGSGGNILMKPGIGAYTNDRSKFKEAYNKNSEKASPGYYSVDLNSGIGVELTVAPNVGFHRYDFPASPDGYVLVDLGHSYASMVDANLLVEGKNEISGMVKAQNVCNHGYYELYYSIQFDQDFTSYKSWNGSDTGDAVASRQGANIGAWMKFDTSAGGAIQAKVGVSTISVEQAKKEREQQVPDWDFAGQHEKARNAWGDVLEKVEITSDDEDYKTIFYTQLYHSFLHPNNVTSSDGTYRAARDENTVRSTSAMAEDFDYYSGWSTWDDFRKYSLYSLLEPKKYENMVKSLVDVYKTRGEYVQWGTGYWPSPTVRNEFAGALILDAYMKGYRDFDVYTALQGMSVDTDSYAVSDGQVSGKLEKAYSASFPMKLAYLLGDKPTFEKYHELSGSYKSLWNAQQKDNQGNVRGFFTPNGQQVAGVEQVNEFAYQGNLWTYRWFVPHDVYGLAALKGGPEALAEDLEYFFDIDEYVAINEPDLHAPFLFNYLGKPYLTQKYAREYTTEEVTQKYHNHGLYEFPIVSRVYRTDPEGYLPSMDDDAGAMSSWFVYSAMGLFPANPGDPYYLIGSPIFPELKLNLNNGKTFTIRANDVSSTNRYIQSATLNGASFDQSWINYADVMAGGVLEFEMGAEPNEAWAASEEAKPPVMDMTKELENTIVQKQIVAKESEWKYHDKGQDLGKDWIKADYDDIAWGSGKAMLGYSNNNDVNTRVGYGPDSGNKYITTYFRKTFELEGAEDYMGLIGSLIRDDGAVVYLNGHEIIRSNMPSGDITYLTPAAATVGSERNEIGSIIDPSYLVEGVNVLAAEVHQDRGSSSDIAFEFSLAGTKQLVFPDAPTEPVVNDEDNTFGWTLVPGYDKLSEYEYSINGGSSWTEASANPQPVGLGNYAAGDVQVRVKADAARDRMAGKVLSSDKPYTLDGTEGIYELEGELKREGNLRADVTVTLKKEYAGPAYVVFQLMDGNTPLLLNAVQVEGEGDTFEASQLYNVNGSRYKVKVFVLDAHNADANVPSSLALPLLLE